MKYDSNNLRRSIRLREYDYSQGGAYFITICTNNKQCFFGHVVNGEMQLNQAGFSIQTTWDELPQRFDNLELDEFITMPNHIHGIVVLRRGDPCDRPSSDYSPSLKEHPKGTLPDTLGRIVQAFKSISTNKYINGVKQHGWPPFPNKLWQRNYWDHVIRHETELNIIREYIRANPTQWKTDKLYTPAHVDGAPVNNLHETSEPDTEYIHKPWMV